MYHRHRKIDSQYAKYGERKYEFCVFVVVVVGQSNCPTIFICPTMCSFQIVDQFEDEKLEIRKVAGESNRTSRLSDVTENQTNNNATRHTPSNLKLQADTRTPLRDLFLLLHCGIILLRTTWRGNEIVGIRPARREKKSKRSHRHHQLTNNKSANPLLQSKAMVVCCAVLPASEAGG